MTKTIINEKGVYSEAGGTDELVVEVRQRKSIQHFAPGTGGAITKPIAVFEGSVVGVTGTLPPVNDSTLGLEFQVINADVSQTIMISGSTGNVIDSGTLLYSFAAEAAKFVAVSSSLDGYSWIVTDLKA